MSGNKKLTKPETGAAVQKRRVREAEVHGLVIALFGVILLLSLVSFDRRDLQLEAGNNQIDNFMGLFGARLADIFLSGFGVIAFVLALGGLLIGLKAVLRRPFQAGVLRIIAPAAGLLFLAVTIHVLAVDHIIFDHYQPGGVIGASVGELLLNLFNRSGTLLISITALSLATLYLAGITIRSALRFTGRQIRTGAGKAVSGLREQASRRRRKAAEMREKGDVEPEVSVVKAIDLTPIQTSVEDSIPELDQTVIDRPRPPQGSPTANPADAMPEEPAPEPAWTASGRDATPIPDVPVTATGRRHGTGIAAATPDRPGENVPKRIDEGQVTKFDIVAPAEMDARQSPIPIVIHRTQSSPAVEHPDTVPATGGDHRTRAQVTSQRATGGASGSTATHAVPPTASGDWKTEVSAAVSPATSQPASAMTVDGSDGGNRADKAPDASNGTTVVASPAADQEAPAIIVNRRAKARVQEDLLLPPPPRGPWEPPSLSLLDFVAPAQREIDQDFLRSNAEKLEAKLLDYKVQGKVVGIHPGPVVTMYEFLPAAGVRISQIANLADDLTMALKATSIRIVAPIPGKGVVGIEVPNKVRETVYLREILASEEFTKSRSKLTIALGKDIFGNPVVTDLARMPHLLIAGATGSGKSVAVNAFILSLLRNATPDEVRIILVDPKVVELNVYENIPHLLLPVVCDPKQAAAALRWACEEMDRRYSLLARFSARNIASFNARIDRLLSLKAGKSAGTGDDDADGLASLDPDEFDIDELVRLPYIVIVLDEFADLMMVASKDVEAAVTRLAQKARAAGIHLVMATQRPSKEVITGLIKSNFPSRIGFRVSSSIDSRIILDQSGAEALLGFGDMLFLKPGTSALERVHGSFVSDDEVMRVVTHLKTQGEPDYQLDIIKDADDVEIQEDQDEDPLTDEAQDIVLESGKASISFLQRRLKIGYNRSARIMEALERRRVVGPPDSRGERRVIEL
ncbi:MAG TPA: DNA translocase FtsK 4TM domain-containing protein [Myxococcota bacterium]|nr:DNA translocase FtsK 4TM domain-containing protein [Myxococcota bacterium]